MNTKILDKIREVECRNGCRVIYAAECGSRSTGLESPDSDYDIKFIYVMPLKFYLSLGNIPDFINCNLDGANIQGWDITKFLNMIKNSNAHAIDLLHSPVVYVNDGTLAKYSNIFDMYFDPRRVALSHIGTAEKIYKSNIFGSDYVKSKIYLYVISSILRCRWVLENNSQPPLNFHELLDWVGRQNLPEDVFNLLGIKLNSSNDKVSVNDYRYFNNYIQTSIEYMKKDVYNHEWDKTQHRIDLLNGVFHDILGV